MLQQKPFCRLIVTLLIISLPFVSGCFRSSKIFAADPAAEARGSVGYLSSGTLTLALQMPERTQISTDQEVNLGRETGSSLLAPLTAYLPLEPGDLKNLEAFEAYAISGTIIIRRRLPQTPFSDADTPELLAAVNTYLPPAVEFVSAEHNVPECCRYAKLGSIVIKGDIPNFRAARIDDIAVENPSAPSQLLAPIIGYVPLSAGFVAADNETWLEISQNAKSLILFRGATQVKAIKGEGAVSLAPGHYALQHKQKNPLWYAPDKYFESRSLRVPAAGNRLRYRRGALGQYVLYPTTTFPIHSAPLWTKDVGGLRVSRGDLSSIYYMLPIGATIVVK